MTLWSLVSGQSALEQAQFVDAISRRLRRSHFMVLVDDRRRHPGGRRVADQLPSTPRRASHRASFGRPINLARWQRPIAGFVENTATHVAGRKGKSPRLDRPAKSRFNRQAIKWHRSKAPPPAPSPFLSRSISTNSNNVIRGSERNFANFWRDISALGVVPEFRNLWYCGGTHPNFQRVARLHRRRRVCLVRAMGGTQRNDFGRPQAGEDYLTSVARVVGGHVRRPEKNWPDVTGPRNRTG